MDKESIKTALGNCQKNNCLDCPYFIDEKRCRANDLLLDTINLINKLESENERLSNTEISELIEENEKLAKQCEDWCEIILKKRNQIAELKDENKRLSGVIDIANEREYRKKFNDEWRKEYQKELDKQGNGYIAGYPDFDLVYKLYFEQKDRIGKLEKDNELLRKAKVVYETVDYCYEDLKKAEKRIAELEKEKEQTMKAWFEDREGMFWDGVGEGELKGYKQLKQFTEKLKEKFNDTEYRAKTKRKTISVEELKAQMDWILHEVVIKNIDETLKEFIE